MIRCDVCGSLAVPAFGPHTCGFCGASDEPPKPARPPRGSPCRFSPRERSDFAAMFGVDALRQLEAEGL